MAIDKKVYDTLEVGAKNQIMSAGSNAEAEALFNKFTQPAPTTSIGGVPVGTADPNKVLRNFNAPAPVSQIKPLETTQNTEGTNIGVILPGTTAPTPTPAVPTAPVTTPTPAPVTPAPIKTPTPIKETKPTVTKLPPAPTPEQIRARQDQINQNIQTEYNRPGSVVKNLIDSGDFEGYKAIYGSTDPNESKVVDALFQAMQPKNSEAIFSMLMQGQTIQNKNTLQNPDYLKAQKRFDDLQKYKNFDQTQFSTLIADGKLVEGTQLYKDLSADPNIKLKLDNAYKINTINKVPTDTDKITNNVMNDIVDGTAIGKAFSDGIITAEEMNSMTSSPEITTKTNEVEKKKTAYDTLKAEYDDIETQVEEELKGTGAISGYKQSLIGERQKNIFKRLNVATSDYNNALGTLSDMKKTQADLMAVNLDLYKIRDQRAYETEKLKEERTYEEQKAEKELQQKFDYTYGDLKSTDPRIQKTAALRMAESIQEQYKGMPFRRSVDVMASDIVNQINSGMTTDQITTDITNAIQNAPTYNEWAMSKGLIAKPKDKKFTSVSAGETIIDENGNVIYKAPEKGTTTTTPTTTTTTPTTTTTTPTTTATPTGNLVTKKIGTSNAVRTLDEVAMSAFDKVASEMSKAGIKLVTGSSYRTKEEQQKLYDRFIKTGKYPAAKPGTSRHETGMAIDIYSDNKLSGPTQAQIAIMEKNGFKHMAIKDDMGHFEYVGTGTTTKPTFNDNDIALLSSVAKLDKQGKDTLKANGFTEQDWANMDAGLLPPTPKQKQQAQSIINSINALETDPGFSAGVGVSGLQPFFTIPGTDKANFVSRFNSFRDNLVLPNLGQLKGPMSDKDIQFLRNSATALDLTMSEKGFKEELTKLKNKYTEILNKGGKDTSKPNASVSSIANRLQQLRQDKK